MKAVPALNKNFSVPKQEANQLWHDAGPLDETGESSEQADRIRLSKNGRWLLLLTQIQNAAKIGNIATNELQFIHRLGLDTLSYAHVPVSPRKLITISPWVPDVKPCSLQQYNNSVRPILLDYYDITTKSADGPYLGRQLVGAEHYSTIPDSNKPFLHNLSPEVHTEGPSLAHFLLRQLV